MTFQVTVRPSQHHFEVEPHESVLEAALRQGVGLPYGCRNGACGSCKGRVVEGTVTHRSHQASTLPPEDVAEGKALFCSALAHSDLLIEVREVDGVGALAIRKLPARVAELDRAAHDVVIMRLQLPAAERFQYLAGQYVEMILKDGKRRSYSMATAPHLAEQVELHVRHTPGGLFTDHVFGAGASQLKVRDILRFEGPFGTFTLREDSDKPIVFLASGTGFAPIKAMVEHCIALKSARPMVLYWGGRRPADLYLDALARSWEEELGSFSYVPVISDALPEDGWSGRTGLVHRAVMADIADLSGYQVYACGAPVMVEAARRDFAATCGLAVEEFFADAFTTQADLARQTLVAD